MNNELNQLKEAFNLILEKHKKNAKKKLSAKQKKIAQAAPPPDQITGADFAALKKKKKTKTLKEKFSFNQIWESAMNEGYVDFSKVHPEAQYIVKLTDGSKKILKGESVLMFDKEDIESIEPAHKE